MFKSMQLSNNFVKPNEQSQACLHFAMARNWRRSQPFVKLNEQSKVYLYFAIARNCRRSQRMRTKYSRLCAYFQAITRMKKKSDNRKCSFVALCRNEATRTPDPYVPNVVRYQLRYIPSLIKCCKDNASWIQNKIKSTIFSPNASNSPGLNRQKQDHSSFFLKIFWSFLPKRLRIKKLYHTFALAKASVP